MAPKVAVGRCGARVEVLGGWALRVAGDTVDLHFRERRVVALLAVRGNCHRVHVAGTLWPDSPESRALANLRAAVWNIRHDAFALLSGTRSSLQLGCEVMTDLSQLRECLALPSGSISAHQLDVLGAPELLPGWYDDWVLLERERLRNRQLRALHAHARASMCQGDASAAEHAAQLAVEVDPLDETSLQLLVEAYVAQGKAAQARRCFLTFQTRLQRELGVAPSPCLVAALTS